MSVNFEHVDESAGILSHIFLTLVRQIIALDVLGSCVDAARRVRATKPLDRSDDRRLKEVELTARGLEHFGFYDHSLIKDMKLPDFSEPTKLAWPPPTVPLGVQIASSMASMIRPHPGANWAAEIDERHRQRREESLRMAEHYEGMAKEREAREALERERMRERATGSGGA